jgi:hypothetical protein
MAPEPGNIGFRAHRDKNKATVVRQVGEKVWLCDSHDVLFIQRMGGLDAARSRFGFGSIGANSYEWIQDGNIPRAATITVNLAAPTTAGDDAFGHPVYTTDLSVTVDHAEYFVRGMVLMIKDPLNVGAPELMWVSEVNTTTNVLTVVRGWRGSPVYAQTAASTPTLCAMTIVAEECHEFVQNYNVARKTYINYWQTFVSGLSKSKKWDYIEHYGVSDDYERQMTKIMGGTLDGRTISGELPRYLEQAVLYGLPSPGGPSGDSSFGGINSFNINQVVVNNLTFDTIQDALETALMQGADIGRLEIVTSPRLQRQISGWLDGTINVDRTDQQVGRRVTSILSDWGEIPVNWHRHLRQDELYIVDFSEMGLLQLWDFTETRLGQTTSLCEDTMIDGSFGFALACDCHHTRIRVTNDCLDPEPCVGPGCYEEPEVEEDPTPGVVVV